MLTWAAENHQANDPLSRQLETGKGTNKLEESLSSLAVRVNIAPGNSRVCSIDTNTDVFAPTFILQEEVTKNMPPTEHSFKLEQAHDWYYRTNAIEMSHPDS